MPEDPAHDQSPVRIAIADSNDLIRLGILGELRALESVKAAGEAGDLDSLVAVIDEHRPDVTFVDLELPGLQEHDNVTEPLRRDNPDLKAVVMSDDTTDMAVIRTFRSIANGFIVKDNTADLLGLAATWVATGGTFIDPQVASILFALTLKGQRNYQGPHGLTVQEQRVGRAVETGADQPGDRRAAWHHCGDGQGARRQCGRQARR